MTNSIGYVNILQSSEEHTKWDLFTRDATFRRSTDNARETQEQLKIRSDARNSPNQMHVCPLWMNEFWLKFVFIAINEIDADHSVLNSLTTHSIPIPGLFSLHTFLKVKVCL